MNFAEKIWSERYAHPGETSWTDMAERVARFVSNGEVIEKQEECYKKFFEIINSQDFIPGGRILTNSGRPRGQLLNCFVIPLEDSRESIGQMLKEYLTISGTGGGVGISFSKLRPRNAAILTNGGNSSGPVSFMDCVDTVASTIKTGGQRRAATMISLSVYHPDIEEFISHKIDLSKLTNANVSIEADDKFFEAVRKNKNWDLIWGNKIVNTIKARNIWDKVVENANLSGEPGILNIGYARKMSNSYSFDELLTTNPCGEQFLPAYGCCCLGSINLSNFIKNNEFEWERFKKVVDASIRFLDDVLAVNTYPLEEIQAQSMKERRIGLGLMGLHHAMLKMNIKYSSKAGNEFTEKIYELLRNRSYLASTKLAEEKGAFPAFDTEAYLNSGFTKTLPTKIRDLIRKHGMRNVCVNTQAPTGTTSIIAGVSSGIEPIFAPMYRRRYNSDKGMQEEILKDPLLDEFIQAGLPISHFEGAYDISPDKHFIIQETAQRYIDSAVSKTINLPEDYTADNLKKTWLKYVDELKGTTLYRSGSRGKEPLSPMPLDAKLAKDLAKKDDHVESMSPCKDGKCDL